MDRRKSVRLPAEPGSAPLARGFCRRTLAAWRLGPATEPADNRPADNRPADNELTDTAGLLVTELVTNALRHSDEPIEVTLTVHADRLRLGVWDSQGSSPPRVVTSADGPAGSGHGLVVVAGLSHAWGSEPTGHGKTVWCELLLPPGSGYAEPGCPPARSEPARPRDG